MNTIINANISFCCAGLFISDKEWIHPDRMEKTYEIIYVTRGEVFMNNGGKEYKITKGQALLLYPQTRHYGSKKTSGVSFYWVHFLTSENVVPPECGLYENIENSAIFKELLHFANLPQKPEYAINAVLCHILALMQYERERNLNSPERIAEEIYEWVRINASAVLTAETTATHFGFSADHLARILKKNFGVGTKKLINRFVAEKAKELLCNTGKYIKEIAAELEFTSDKAFILFFKYHEDAYPSQFRDKFRKVHMNNK